MKLLAVTLIAQCATCCSRSLEPREAAAVIQAADLLTVHDADRLIARFIELQQRLPQDILTHQDCPSLFRWDAIEPESLSANAIKDMGLEGTNFPDLTAVAIRPIESASMSEDDSEATAENDGEEDEAVVDEADPVAGTRTYLTLAPLSNTSSASWPVVIMSTNGYQVVAANLRDYFAQQLITYAPPADNSEFWMRIVSELWVGLRLGIADPAAIAQRRKVILRALDP
ncbi:MAG: hypothetical protein VX223_01245 [Myxococcota bacterium]|nr:hypothetical protein [Myxococcota bacterium]